MKARDSISKKIDHLFITVLRADGREYTYDDVERGTDGRVSRSYVWKLRHGRNGNPSLDVIEALSQFFMVPPSYFFGQPLADDVQAREAAAVSALLNDPLARGVAERARGLSPSSIHAIENLVDSLRKIEGLKNGRSRQAITRLANASVGVYETADRSHG